MKKLIYLFFLSIVVSGLCSCSNNNDLIEGAETDSTEKMYDVLVQLSGFTSGVVEMKSTTNENVGIKYLVYEVYDNQGLIIDKGIVDTDTVVKTLILRLKKGNYKLSILASDKLFKAQSVLTSDLLNNQDAYYTSLIVKDLTSPNVFQGSLDFSVDNTTLLNQTILLTRPIGKISLQISDLNKLPSDIQSITPMLVRESFSPYQYKVYILPQYIQLNNAKGLYKQWSKYDESSNPLQDNTYQNVNISRNKFTQINETNSFDFYLPQTESSCVLNSGDGDIQYHYSLYLQTSKKNQAYPYFFDVSSLNNENIVSMIPLATDIVVKPNKQIIIKGKIFGDDQLSLVINDVWGETTTNTFE